MVVEDIRQCWNDWIFYLRLLLLLLLPPKWNEWDASGLFLLWVHGNNFICCLPHVRKFRVPLQSFVCEAYLLTSEVRLKYDVLVCGGVYFS